MLHVQVSVETEGETTFAVIEVVRGDAEVGKNCVYLFNVVITQKIVQVTEITAYKGEMRIVDNVPFGILRPDQIPATVRLLRVAKESRANDLLLQT